MPDDAVITQASVHVYVTGKSDSKNDSNGFVSVVQGGQASTASLVGTDYARAGNAITNPTEGSNRLDISNIGTTSYARWDSNTTGIGWVSKISATKLALAGRTRHCQRLAIIRFESGRLPQRLP
ncbi:MAG: hypothetical protein U0641_01125 [Anaerolineae bacterium]